MLLISYEFTKFLDFHLPARSDKIGETMFHGLILVGRCLYQVSLHISDKQK
jgi:hypothetical protein